MIREVSHVCHIRVVYDISIHNDILLCDMADILI